MSRPKIEISEVGPRDGLQNVDAVMATPAKRRWIAALSGAGLGEIEVCSFVPPKLVPGMADAAEVTRFARTLPELTVAVLAPNLRGAEAALEAGAQKITVPLSVSRSHNLANVRRTPEESLAEVREICGARDRYPKAERAVVEGGLSTVFGCSIEGRISLSDVLRLSVALVEAGVDEVGLADTTGMGNPAQVRATFRAVAAEIGWDRLAGAHFHNTRGQGLANVVAALEVGVTTFDASQGGLGGCPFAPGATGNIVTEDLVWMLEESGCDTGVDLAALIAAREILSQALPEEPLHGYVPSVGLAMGGGTPRIADTRAAG
ncbi:MAG: hydroxymethylglutaryl-CoA lyase [Rhodospirillales bacterium]